MSTRNRLARTPPMGWNSWLCYATTVCEAEVRATADYMARHLRQHGWEYIVIDALWYGPHPVAGTYRENVAMEMDAYGRWLPAVNRFPSAADGAGFKPLADDLHRLGLKFGIHLMRGIPRQAVAQNTSVLRTPYRAQDIADTAEFCPWNPDMYGMNLSHPGAQAYYDSVAALCAEWGIDYIKADDMGTPYYPNHVAAFSQAIRKRGRDIVLSISPGLGMSVQNAAHLKAHNELWRITADLWDRWEPEVKDSTGLKNQFDAARQWAEHIGPGHWPDLDLLPLGRIGPSPHIGSDRLTRLTRDEQIMLMTLWVIFRSPLMFGGNLTSVDEFTLSLLTNTEVLAVHRSSMNNREVFARGDHIAWSADVPDSADKYLALFNLGDARVRVEIAFQELGLPRACVVRDLWTRQDLGSFQDSFASSLDLHAAGLYCLTPLNTL